MVGPGTDAATAAAPDADVREVAEADKQDSLSLFSRPCGSLSDTIQGHVAHLEACKRGRELDKAVQCDAWRRSGKGRMAMSPPFRIQSGKRSAFVFTNIPHSSRLSTRSLTPRPPVKVLSISVGISGEIVPEQCRASLSLRSLVNTCNTLQCLRLRNIRITERAPVEVIDALG